MIDPIAALPRYRIGSISPLDLIDSSTYEFYAIAPPGVIQSSISIGLGGFSEDAAQDAFAANLTRCVQTLAKREVSVAMLNGLPLLLHLTPDDLALFAKQSAEVGIRPADGMQAAIAAIKALNLKTVTVGNKWSPDLNRRLGETLANEGIEVIGTSTDPQTADQVKSSFESGATLALELATRAHESAPDADGIYLAGGAWLTLHLIDQVEQQFGKPVVTGQQSAHWYSLNLAGCFVPRTDLGALLSCSMTNPSEKS